MLWKVEYIGLFGLFSMGRTLVSHPHSNVPAGFAEHLDCSHDQVWPCRSCSNVVLAAPVFQLSVRGSLRCGTGLLPLPLAVYLEGVDSLVPRQIAVCLWFLRSFCLQTIRRVVCFVSVLSALQACHGAISLPVEVAHFLL